MGTEHSFICRTSAATVDHRAACGPAAQWRRWEVGWYACLARRSRELVFPSDSCAFPGWLSSLSSSLVLCSSLPSVGRAVDVSMRRHAKGQSLPVSFPGECPGVSAQCMASSLSSSRRSAIAAVWCLSAIRRVNVRGCPTPRTSAVCVWLACLAHGARHNSLRPVSSSVSRHRLWCRCRCRCRVRRCRSRCGTGLLLLAVMAVARRAEWRSRGVQCAHSPSARHPRSHAFSVALGGGPVAVSHC